MKHTPGPWNGCNEIIGAGGVVVCEVFATESDIGKLRGFSESDANARLISAAPEILEALKLAAEVVKTARKYFPKSMHNGDKFQLEVLCATIGKAITMAGGE